MNPDKFILEHDAVMRPYTTEVAAYCDTFSCEDNDLDEFFSKDAFIYDTELLGKTYAWINISNPSKILGLVTLSNDSVKAQYIAVQRETVYNAALLMPSEEEIFLLFLSDV